MKRECVIRDLGKGKKARTASFSTVHFQQWPANPNILISWQEKSIGRWICQASMTLVIEVCQLLPLVLTPCSPSELVLVIYLMSLGVCILLLT